MLNFGAPLMAVNENHDLMSPLQRAALNAIISPLHSAAEAALAEATRMLPGTAPDPLAGVAGAALAEAVMMGLLPDPLTGAVGAALDEAQRLQL